MSENKFTDMNKKQFEHYLQSTVQISMMYYLVWDEMEKITAQKLHEFPNLTHEYYLKLICHYLKQYRFIHKEMKLMFKPNQKFLLEKQLTIIAEYFQPDVPYWAVETWLEETVQTVLSRLREKHPAHSIFSAISEQFSFWSNNNIADNFWNEVESRQIINILKKCIFRDTNYYKFGHLLKILHLAKKYKIYTEEDFSEYVQIVMFHIVTRKLGIHTIMMKYREETFAVVWKPEYNRGSWNNAEYFYMNEQSPNIVRKRCQNHERSLNLLEPIDYKQMILEMMMNIVKKSRYDECKPTVLVDGWKFDIFYDLFNSCTSRNVKSIDIKAKYKNVINSIEIKSDEKHVKKRTKNIKFAVGTIVRHTKFGSFSQDNHDGVIIGWHHGCKKILTAIMFPLLHQYRNYLDICICHLLCCTSKTHYIILAKNNRICYIREGMITCQFYIFCTIWKNRANLYSFSSDKSKSASQNSHVSFSRKMNFKSLKNIFLNIFNRQT